MNLIPGKNYKIKHTKEFCHAYGVGGGTVFGKNVRDLIFVGRIQISDNQWRNIFYSMGNYFMFGDKIDYIIDNEKTEILNQIEVLQKELEILKARVK